MLRDFISRANVLGCYWIKLSLNSFHNCNLIHPTFCSKIDLAAGPPIRLNSPVRPQSHFHQLLGIMTSPSKLQALLYEYPLVEAILPHIEPVDFVNLQLAGIIMPINKATAIGKMIKKKCQSLSGCDITNEKEALITCSRAFELEGTTASTFDIEIDIQPQIPHCLREMEGEWAERRFEEYVCRRHLLKEFERGEPYSRHAWKAVCSHHSRGIAVDPSKRTLPEVCICHAARAEKGWSCHGCQEVTFRVLEGHYTANIDAKLHQVHLSRATRQGFVDIKKVEKIAPWHEWSDWDKMFEDWQSLGPCPCELRRMCPLDGCEEEGSWDEVDGQFRVMYCVTCRGFFQVA